MKQLLLSLAQYNAWANLQMIALVEKLDAPQLDAELQGSFPSIRKTVYHIWMAESIWNSRLALTENPVIEAINYNGDFAEALQKWKTESHNMIAFVQKQFSDDAFLHEYIYVDLKKQSHKNSVYQTLQHVCNHSTFHRGQLINYFRALGIGPLSSTDYIHWCRRK
jgi:uncharacterized damage-inducible protein DinB